ncbi:glycoside hydrolase family 43 protein [Saccharophagus degradans]|uniref:Glycoside hydrolase family 43 protein n=1 Tax=Saccharophagus degradans TaxID=86304 RepID=A0AAW7X660_9GAMM|nr:glycoside hydrolase family 43 protein [Saccharophagus degradans]MDO6423141.1 glycoside hydrolase family 43 protein [Saccharophagus degradans]MDO6607335.1 glycoside hydrolase family 43 protein [Saccharophagus degradans]
MFNKKTLAASIVAACLTNVSASYAANPAITDTHTADPAALVHGDTVYLYVGNDEAKDNRVFYDLKKWLVYSSKDMVNWTNHGSPLAATDFKWASGDAWAAHTVEKDGKFYWYTTVRHATINGFAIGVAVSDSPTGPFKDALGKALISNDMTTDTDIDWDDIDPAVFIDDDGQAYIFWGNTKPRWAKLKPNMIELDGPIHAIDIPHFTEALYVHKHGEYYYLSYATGFPEKTAYAMSKSIEGPWEYKGILNELAGNSNTNHQSVIDFKGKSYFIYHNGGLGQDGGSFRRSVCIDYLNYNADGTIKRIVMTSEGVDPVK